jgi:hypothetical protein
MGSEFSGSQFITVARPPAGPWDGIRRLGGGAGGRRRTLNIELPTSNIGQFDEALRRDWDVARGFTWGMWRGHPRSFVTCSRTRWFSHRGAGLDFHQRGFQGFLGCLLVVVGLEVEPDLGRPAEVAFQAQGGIHGEGAPAFHDISLMRRKRSTEHLSHFCQRSGGSGIYAARLSMVTHVCRMLGYLRWLPFILWPAPALRARRSGGSALHPVGRPGLRIPDSVRWRRRRCRSGESWFRFGSVRRRCRRDVQRFRR